ncbi:MAG: 3-keto-5-aminohexanoate cleavage protein [Candidatus Latescibacterota bacterium]|nr:3-keto-5-aminohexanoate cleavage protein [Candidatus Latescibacterota bacterium]
MEKTIITVALSGSVPTREMTPHVPLTPEEISESAEKCRAAGASVAHVHARDAEGHASLDPELFLRIHELITARTDMVVQISTGGRADLDAELRAEPVRRICPEMASLTTGSMNFPDEVYANSFETVALLASVMKKAGTKPEMEIFEAGMIENALQLVDKGLADAPLLFDFVMGSRGSQPATARQLTFLSETVPQASSWTVAGIGRHQLTMGVLAIGMGGHVRVGLEDNIYYRRGELASNEQLVARMTRISDEAERGIATPDEARALMHLPAR